MPRQSTGSKRQSRSKASRNVIPGGPSYFRKAVERGAAKGQMAGGYRLPSGAVSKGYTSVINAVVASGVGVEIAEIHNVPASQRKLIGQHWKLVYKLVDAQTPKQREEAERELQDFIKAHKQTGGTNPQEFASNPDDIVEAHQANSKAFKEGPYPKGKQ